MPQWLETWISSLEDLTWWEILGYSVVVAALFQLVMSRFVLVLTGRTKTEVDDRIVRAIRWPLFASVLLVGIGLSLRELVEAPDARHVFRSILWTIAIFLWMRALMRVSDALLDMLARRVDDFQWIEPRSLPLYEIAAKLLVIGVVVYAIMLVWNLDVTAWLASAGILGIAIGFAAKDTLANLFAGIFILADAPYQIGDYIVLGTGERGRVTDIGIRSTRILMRDDMEVTIPNGVIANAKIVNETRGPSRKRRVRVDVGVAYESDLDHVRKVLLEVAGACDLVAPNPKPSVRVRGFGDSSIPVQLRGYIEEPVLKGRVVDRLCTDIHKRFKEEGIEIAFPQRVVHVADGEGSLA